MAHEIPGFNPQHNIVLNLISFIIVVYILFHLTSKECTHHTDCGSYSYCGVDDKCHNSPIEKEPSETIIKEQNSLIVPSIIVSLFLITGSILYVKKNEK